MFGNFDINTIIDYIVILLVSITWHELAHALTATYLGDDTPKRTGHLSLNPLRHTDQFGIILLLISSFAGFPFAYGFTPVNERNLRPNPKLGGGIVAVAGPISNLILAGLLALVLRYGQIDVYSGVANFLGQALLVNVFLAIFNILPIPPLDGWRVLETFLTPRQLYDLRAVRQYGPYVLLLLFLFGGQLGFFGWLQNTLVYPIAQGLLSV